MILSIKTTSTLDLQRGLSIELRSTQVLVQANRIIHVARPEEQLKPVDACITLPFTYNLPRSLPQLLERYTHQFLLIVRNPPHLVFYLRLVHPGELGEMHGVDVKLGNVPMHATPVIPNASDDGDVRQAILRDVLQLRRLEDVRPTREVADEGGTSGKGSDVLRCRSSNPLHVGCGVI